MPHFTVLTATSTLRATCYPRRAGRGTESELNHCQAGGKHCDVAFLRGDGEVFGGSHVGRSLQKTADGDPRKLRSEKERPP